MIFLKVLVQIFRNVTGFFLTLVDIFPAGLFHNIDIADEFAVLTNGEMKGRDLLAVKFGKLLHNLAVADVVHIHIRYKEHTGEFIFLAEFPCLLCSHLHAGLAGNHDDRGVRRADSLFHFAYKVKVSRCVKNVNLHLIPRNRKKCCGN